MLKDEVSWLLRRTTLRWLFSGTIASFFLVWAFTLPVFIQPAYRSQALIFVPLTLFTQQFEQHGIGFASDAEIDGHIQVLQSTRLLDSLDHRFDLSEQYGIDRTLTGSAQKLYDRLGRNINIEKTRYNSVSVTVRDHDAEQAAAMANAIVELGDVIKESLLFDNRMTAYRVARELYHQKMEEVNALEEQYAKTELLPGDRSYASIMDYNRKQQVYEEELHELTRRRNRYEIMRKTMEVKLPEAYVISPAVSAYRPAWPPRLLLSFSAAVIYMVVFLFVEMIRKDVRALQKQ